MKKSLTAGLLAMATLFAAGSAAVAAESPSAGSSSQVTDVRKVAPYVDPSVVYIVTTFSGQIYDKYQSNGYVSDGKTFSVGLRCTGFVVNPDGYIGTAGHCVRYDDDIKAQILLKGIDDALASGEYGTASRNQLIEHAADNWRVVGKEKVSKPDREVSVSWAANVSGIDVSDGKEARVFATQPQDSGDSAVIKVDESDLNALPLVQSDDELDTGTEIASVGFAASTDEVTQADYQPSVKTGTISAFRPLPKGLVSVYEINSEVSGGMSGGPTVTYDGAVVGVNSFGIYGETQNFNFIHPTTRMLELLNSLGVKNEVSDITQQYRDGIDAYFAKDRTTAVKDLTAVTKEQPANGIAADYLDKAKQLPIPKPEESSNTGLIIGIIVALVVLALIAGLVIFLLTRGRKKGAAQPPVAGAPYAPPPVAGQPAGYPPPPGPATAATGTSSTAVLDQPPAAPGGTPAAPPAAPGGTPAAPPAATPAAPAAPAEDAEAVFCSHCGTHAEEPGQKFCKHCGAAL